MRSVHPLVLVSALLLVPAGAGALDDLHLLSDEFDTPLTLGEWRRIHMTEGWNAEQLEVYDIAETHPGRMTMIPYTVVWYRDWRGPMSYKEVTGDFVTTTDVRTTGRDGVSVPSALFSLGGVMIRSPRDVTPETWQPGGEDYVFLSLGYGAGPSQFQFEDKTTDDSNSQLLLSPAPGPEATLQVARIGEYVIALRRAAGGAWQVHRRFHRPDLPGTLQVGLVTYTDWAKCEPFDPWVHNGTTLTPPLPPGVDDPRPDLPFDPDLLATFDYARFARPALPPELAGVDLTDPNLVPDAVLLSFLGEAANDPGLPATSVAPARESGIRLSLASVPAAGKVELHYRLPGAKGTLSVVDPGGRLLARYILQGGEGSAVWDGRNRSGAEAGSGIFFARLEAGEGAVTRRIVRISGR